MTDQLNNDQLNYQKQEGNSEGELLQECPFCILDLCLPSCPRFFTQHDLILHAKTIGTVEVIISLAEECFVLKKKVEEMNKEN